MPTKSVDAVREDFDRLRGLHARVIRDSVTLVRRVTPEDLTRPTPCSGWDLADLLAHMTAQHHGFAAAAVGHGHDLAHWRVPPWGYEAAAERVLTAFAAVDGPEQPFALPEFGAGRTFPARRAVGFHFLDYVAHSWDVARSLGRAYDPGPDVLAAALPIAGAVPDDDFRRAPASPFRPGLAPAADAGPLERILAMLGRSVGAAC
ncbi:TIGR03086 family protein [Streptomyces sp. ISL-36]|uniref:TIGR03086 family metal-binding protein n=1 Tax=Streptomyces sp. ISL-36 TaxID=2819182 RepID=UPI001BE95953|nr:TIGR03086 family metal-binding protein [Streptomyces sp. ISL-36]MBT2440825.1 TIGR03086 family protein [Streptomyces sp. ISL-36]